MRNGYIEKGKYVVFLRHFRNCGEEGVTRTGWRITVVLNGKKLNGAIEFGGSKLGFFKEIPGSRFSFTV